MTGYFDNLNAPARKPSATWKSKVTAPRVGLALWGPHEQCKLAVVRVSAMG
jgi:hypothetical protein